MPNKIPAVGSRPQVWHGNAKHTKYGLTKDDLKKNQYGKIVSKIKSASAKRMYAANDKMRPGTKAEMAAMRPH